MDIFKGIGDFFGGLFGQKKKREDEQQQPQQQQSAVSFNSIPKLGDNFANNLSNPTQPQQPKEFAKSSVDLNPVKPVQPIQPQPQMNRDQERQQLADKYRQEETDRYNQGSDHAANFLNDIFSGGKTAQMRENTINQNIQNRVNAEMLRKYGPDDQQAKQNIAQTSQNINKNATAVSDFTKNYNDNLQQTVVVPVSAVKGAVNTVGEFVPKTSGALTEFGANTIKLFDEDNQFANNLIKRVRADREKNIVRKTLNDATGLTDQDNKMAYGLGSSGTRMAIDAAMTPVTGGTIPALVHGVEAHSEMMDSLDNIEARKKAEAAAKGEAYTPSSFTSRYLASTANAGAQAAIEKLGIDNVTGKIGGKFAKNMVGRAVTGALGEAGEEAAQQYAENFTKKLFDNKQNIHEGVAESALMGGIMGGAGKMAFGGMDSVKNPYKSNDMADGEVSISKLHPDQMGYNKDAVLGNTKRNTYYNPKALYEAERNATIPTREKITLADAEMQNRGGDLQYTPRRETNIGRLDGDQLGFTKDELVGKFTGDTRKRMSERSFNMLQDLRTNNPYVTGDGQEISLTNKGNKKISSYTTGTGTDAEFIAKQRLVPRIKDVIEKSQYLHSADDSKVHGIAPDGFDYRNIRSRYAGKSFDNTLNIAKNNAQNINSLYGITTKENTGTSNFRENSSTGSYSDVSGDSLAQNDQNVNDGIKYKLSPEQEAFFKDSKIRDEDGNLRTVYHGTGANFDAFDKEKVGNGWLGKGFYFTPDKDVARSFGKNIKENYINVKNPFVVEGHNPTDVYSEITARYPEANEFNMSEVLANHGYDGIQFNHWDKGEMITAFEPNQVKYTSNLSPTDSADMRFKQKAEAENLARVAKENLQARHQELTGDQSIAFNEWANELERRAQGFFDEKTGKITINDGDLNTLNHELGHKLLTRADNRAELLADIRNTVGDEALNAKYGENYAQQVVNMNPEERANLFAEEYLADGFSDYYNGILAGEDSQRLGAKLGIPPRVLAVYDRIVEAIKGILGLQQDTLKQFYAQAETGKFAQNYKQNAPVYNENPVYKIAQDSKGDLAETDQKTRKFAETVLDTDTPPKDFVKLMHAGDESLKYTPKKNSELWNKAAKSVQESPERVFNELENTRVANDETMAKGIALAKHYQAMGDDLKASELYVELAKKATEAGRTVQALNLMRRTTPEGVLMSTMREVESYNDKMKDKPNKQINITPEQRAEFLGKLREAYAMPEGDLKEIRARRIAIGEAIREVRDQIPSSKWDKFTTLWKAGLLTAPTTHIRNIAGNIINGGSEKTAQTVGSAFDWMISKGTGKAYNFFTRFY